MKNSGFKMKGYNYPGTSPKASPARSFWKKVSRVGGKLARGFKKNYAAVGLGLTVMGLSSLDKWQRNR